MRTLTLAAVALLVVLAGSGIAGASVVTLSFGFANSTIYKTADDPNTEAIENRPTSTTYSVYAAVTANSWTATSGGPPAAATLYGGIKGWEVKVMTSSNLGKVTATPDPVKETIGEWANTTFNKGTIGATDYFCTVSPTPGNIVNSAGVITVGGTGGVFGDGKTVSSTAAAMTATNSTTAWRTDAMTNALMTPSQKKFTWGNTESPYSAGGGPTGTDPAFNVPVLLFTGEFNAVDVGDVTVDIAGTSNMRLWTLTAQNGAGTLKYSTEPTGGTTGASHVLTVGADAPLVTNLAPHDATITSGNVGELDWNTESGGWNDLGHWVDITATAVDDGKPNPPALLTYEWTMTKPSVAPLIIAGKTSALLRLTLDDIDSLGLPAFPGEVWQLKVRASDGALWSAASAPIDVFVPEPATLGLLGFGIVGALLRRRRRA